jgi:hypothetical protein
MNLSPDVSSSFSSVGFRAVLSLAVIPAANASDADENERAAAAGRGLESASRLRDTAHANRSMSDAAAARQATTRRSWNIPKQLHDRDKLSHE